MSRLSALPLALTALLVGLGILTASAFDHWRVGSGLVGVALCLGAVLRLTLPQKQAGLLVARSRTVDATVLLGLGLAVVALANTIPATR